MRRDSFRDYFDEVELLGHSFRSIGQFNPSPGIKKNFNFFSSTEKISYLSHFTTKIYVVGTHWKHLNEALKHLNEALPMSSHNICFP